MKNYWKWILGIVIVLVVLFGLGIGARLLMAKYLPARAGDVDGFRPMMGGRGFDHFGGGMHFGGGFMMLGGLISLGLLGLLAYGAYRLCKGKLMLGKPAALVATVATPAAPTATCRKCGQPVLEGWNHCPSCGKKL